jgi:hypothetical protein
MIKRIVAELKGHIAFTALGAGVGIIIMVIVVLTHVPHQISHTVFYTLHPAHVLLSALVTTAMYKKYSHGRLWKAIIIGYLGSIGIATISDSIIPYLGEILLKLPHGEAHIGCIEEWWLVNPLALAGILIGYWRPTTRLPHSGHVLISTGASLFHIIMALGETVSWVTLLVTFLFLFLAVWLPCCLSDIAFPLLFVGKVATSEHIPYNHNHNHSG